MSRAAAISVCELTEFTIYLLHFERPVGLARHYVGITHTGRLGARLNEHERGRGSRLVAAALSRPQAGAVVLAQTFPADSHEQEKRFKARGRYANLCPCCCDGAPDRRYRTVPPLGTFTRPPDYYLRLERFSRFRGWSAFQQKGRPPK